MLARTSRFAFPKSFYKVRSNSTISASDAFRGQIGFRAAFLYLENKSLASGDFNTDSAFLPFPTKYLGGLV